jgi:hypothetical protein
MYLPVRRDAEGYIDWTKIASFIVGLAFTSAVVWITLISLIAFTRKAL